MLLCDSKAHILQHSKGYTPIFGSWGCVSSSLTSFGGACGIGLWRHSILHRITQAIQYFKTKATFTWVSLCIHWTHAQKCIRFFVHAFTFHWPADPCHWLTLPSEPSFQSTTILFPVARQNEMDHSGQQGCVHQEEWILPCWLPCSCCIAHTCNVSCRRSHWLPLKVKMLCTQTCMWKCSYDRALTLKFS